MKKSDIVEKLAEKQEITKTKAAEILDSVVNIIKNGIKSDGEVDIYGFVKFIKVHKEAGTARSPKTGETVNTEAKDVPKAKFSSAFKRELNT